MSRFQSWIALIFIINIHFIVKTEESNNPVKRPWLDLNLDPQELPKTPEELTTIHDETLETSVPILEGPKPCLDLIPEAEDLGNPPEEIIYISGDNVTSGAQIPESSSSSDYDAIKQYNMEKWFKKSGQIWDELRSNTMKSNRKWGAVCREMVKKFKEPEGFLRVRWCSPSRYIIDGKPKWRRIMFKEMKQRVRGHRGSEAPDLLLCHCGYYKVDDAKDQVYFAVRHYEGNEYFLLVRLPKGNHTTYTVNNIHTLEISSHIVEYQNR